MKKYGKFSKIIVFVCILGVALSVINFFTGLINPIMSTSSFIFCIIGCAVSAGATIILENERIKKKN